jgi:hypothetical protein
MTIEELEKRVKKIEERNHRVELNKAWETSLFRKIAIISLTYIVVSLYMLAIGIANPLLNAVIPSLGFFLSTLTIEYLKNRWIRTKRKLGNL